MSVARWCVSLSVSWWLDITDDIRPVSDHCLRQVSGPKQLAVILDMTIIHCGHRQVSYCTWMYKWGHSTRVCLQVNNQLTWWKKWLFVKMKLKPNMFFSLSSVWPQTKLISTGDCYMRWVFVVPCSNAYLKVWDVFKDKGIADWYLLLNLVIHGLYICLVDTHTLLCQRRCIINWNILNLWMIWPEFIWKKDYKMSNTMLVAV